MPAIPTSGSSGIILAVLDIWLVPSLALKVVGYPTRYQEVGMGRIIRAAQPLGSRRTCHTAHTGPAIPVSPVDRMVCAASGLATMEAPGTRGPRSASPTAPEGKTRRCPHRRQIVWGGCNGRQQCSSGSVSNSGGLPRRGHAGGRRDGGDRSAKGGSAVLSLRRGAWRGGPRDEMAHPLRRRGLSLPAARLDVTMQQHGRSHRERLLHHRNPCRDHRRRRRIGAPGRPARRSRRSRRSAGFRAP